MQQRFISHWANLEYAMVLLDTRQVDRGIVEPNEVGKLG